MVLGDHSISCRALAQLRLARVSSITRPSPAGSMLAGKRIIAEFM